MSLRIGLDATPLTKPKAGVGNYIFYLLEELILLKPDCQFYLYAPTSEGDLKYFSRYSNVTLCTDRRLSQSHSIWGQTTLAYGLIRDRIEVFWATTQSFPLIKRREMKVLLTLHDFVYLLYPKTVSSFKCFVQRLLTRTMLKKANSIIPNSFGTAERLKQYYGLDHHGIIEPPLKPWLKPIEAPLLEKWVSQKQLCYNDYILTIGTLEPRKNFEGILRAYSATLLEHDHANVFPLVIMGGEGWKNAHLKTLLVELKSKYPQKIITTGYISDEEQWRYLAAARYLLMLSHYEGYGMPIAEARLCGVDVICSNTPEMREAALEQGVFIDANKIHEQLCPLFLRSAQPVITDRTETRYPTNREKASRLAAIVDDLSPV